MVLAGVLQREELVGIVHSYVLCTLYVDGCVCKEAMHLYIVLQVSSELYIVPTNIYSNYSSTVRRRHFHCIMESQSAQYVQLRTT